MFGENKLVALTVIGFIVALIIVLIMILRGNEQTTTTSAIPMVTAQEADRNYEWTYAETGSMEFRFPRGTLGDYEGVIRITHRGEDHQEFPPFAGYFRSDIVINVHRPDGSITHVLSEDLNGRFVAATGIFHLLKGNHPYYGRRITSIDIYMIDELPEPVDKCFPMLQGRDLCS